MKYLFLFLFGLFTTPAFSQFVHRSTLIGTGGVGQATSIAQLQGTSVSISGDGNVAIVGSAIDSTRGAAWVYIRNGNQWVQEGKKLVANDYVGQARFGFTTAISYNGSTIAIGGYEDNNGLGATWVFERNGNQWI